jgi:Spy/CpxP family protein refolding chaperone
MASFKTIALAVALVTSATSLAMAQNGPPTPPAGGASSGMSSGNTMSHHKMTQHKKTSDDKMKSQ